MQQVLKLSSGNLPPSHARTFLTIAESARDLADRNGARREISNGLSPAVSNVDFPNRNKWMPSNRYAIPGKQEQMEVARSSRISAHMGLR
jgi:hypothetical protein